MAIITDEKMVDDLLARGVEIIYPTYDELRKKLLSGERLKLYGGFDPSAPSLHIGNAILINKLSQFQALGHEVIFLIGDFTGMIGDPTDKTATRKKLTREEVLVNCASYVKQASAYLSFEGENPARIVYNSEWLDKLTFKDLIELTSHFTVQQMLQRDMFQKRMEEGKPVHLHEFLYPLAQGYDSVFLDVDLEVGGNDQMFNMMAGRDLGKSMGRKEKCVVTLKLLTDDNGKKMGKSEGNAVFLDMEPSDIYGAVMSWTDGTIPAALELATKVPMARIEEVKKLLASGANPRDLKMELAFEITSIVSGKEAAQAAQDHFVRTIQNKEVPEEIEEKKLGVESVNFVDVLVKYGMAESKSEARRVIEQGGVKIDGEVVMDIAREIIIPDSGVLIQKGKRRFMRIIK